MTWVYPTDQARVTTRMGIESAYFWVSTIFIVGAMALAAAYSVVEGTTVVPAALSLGGLWLILAVGLRWRTIPPVFVGVLVTTGGVLAWVIAASLPSDTSDFVALAAIVASTAIGSNLDRWSGAVGAVVGYAVGQGAVLLGGGPFVISALVAAVCVAGYYSLLLLARGEGRSVAARLDAAGLSELAASERRTLELRSRALVHDTVLGELAAIGLQEPGPLSPAVRASIRASLDAVRLPTGAAPEAPPVAATITRVLSRVSRLGVDVSLSGDPASLELLAPDARQALVLAIDQALVNVATHANTTTAELSIFLSGQTVVVTIVDGGVGFDENLIARDRFGFRESIRGRVEAAGGSARIHSRPGQGTSIVLTCALPGVSE